MEGLIVVSCIVLPLMFGLSLYLRWKIRADPRKTADGGDLEARVRKLEDYVEQQRRSSGE